MFFLGCLAGGAAIAFPAAGLWVWLADPPTVEVTASGAFFGEAELNQQVEVTLWFLALGAVLGLVCGLVVSALGNRYGVLTVLSVLVLCGVASVVTAYVGVEVWGPQGPTGSASPAVGTVLRSELEIGSQVAYLGWPIGGLIGALAGIARWPRSDDPQPLAVPSDTVSYNWTSSRGI